MVSIGEVLYRGEAGLVGRQNGEEIGEDKSGEDCIEVEEEEEVNVLRPRPPPPNGGTSINLLLLLLLFL